MREQTSIVRSPCVESATLSGPWSHQSREHSYAHPMCAARPMGQFDWVPVAAEPIPWSRGSNSRRRFWTSKRAQTIESPSGSTDRARGAARAVAMSTMRPPAQRPPGLASRSPSNEASSHTVPVSPEPWLNMNGPLPCEELAPYGVSPYGTIWGPRTQSRQWTSCAPNRTMLPWSLVRPSVLTPRNRHRPPNTTWVPVARSSARSRRRRTSRRRGGSSSPRSLPSCWPGRQG